MKVNPITNNTTFSSKIKYNETMQKAANSLYQLNSDAVARQCAQSRADAAPCLHLNPHAAYSYLF